jgi:hypothetical protein
MHFKSPELHYDSQSSTRPERSYLSNTSPSYMHTAPPRCNKLQISQMLVGLRLIA